MALWKKGYVPWNKGMKYTELSCKKCGLFISKSKKHKCRSVELKGKRFCIECGDKLSNKGWERYSKICGVCGKKKQRKAERLLRKKLIKDFGGKCQIKSCGYNKYEECLEFHHLSKKDKKNKHFLKEVLKHPKKFRLLCNRCHREKHIKDLRNWR